MNSYVQFNLVFSTNLCTGLVKSLLVGELWYYSGECLETINQQSEILLVKSADFHAFLFPSNFEFILFSQELKNLIETVKGAA